MKNSILIILLGCTLVGCQIPSTKDLDKDIEDVTAQLISAEKEDSLYSACLIKSFIEMRIQTLKNTKAMLEQKRYGINRFTNIRYTVNGKIIESNNKILMDNVDKKIDSLIIEIDMKKLESSRYGECLIKSMLDASIATLDLSVSLLKMKKISLEYNLPLYIPEEIK